MEPSGRVDGKYLGVYRRQGDGGLKCIRVAFNSNAPAGEPSRRARVGDLRRPVPGEAPSSGVDEAYRARPMAANIETGPTTTSRLHHWWRDGTRLRTEQQPRDPIPVLVATTRGDVEIDLATSALLVIDMQRDACDDDGFAHRHGRDTAPARALIEPINGLAAAFRARSVPVVFVGWGNRHDLADVPASLLHVYDPDASDPRRARIRKDSPSRARRAPTSPMGSSSRRATSRFTNVGPVPSMRPRSTTSCATSGSRRSASPVSRRTSASTCR